MNVVGYLTVTNRLGNFIGLITDQRYEALKAR